MFLLQSSRSWDRSRRVGAAAQTVLKTCSDRMLYPCISFLPMFKSLTNQIDTVSCKQTSTLETQNIPLLFTFIWQHNVLCTNTSKYSKAGVQVISIIFSFLNVYRLYFASSIGRQCVLVVCCFPCFPFHLFGYMHAYRRIYSTYVTVLLVFRQARLGLWFYLVHWLVACVLVWPWAWDIQHGSWVFSSFSSF